MYGEKIMQLKFGIPLLSTLLTMGSISIFASSGADRSDMDDTSLLTQSHANNQQNRVILPAAGTRVQNGADVYLTADFLYWEARQGNTEFAMTGIDATGSGSTSLSLGQTYAPDFKYEPAFRVGLGLGIGHDAWDIFVQYTWYHQNANPTAVSHPDNSVEALRPTANIQFVTGTNLTYADGEWTLRLNSIDLEIGRDSYFSKYLSLRYYYGLKAVWQNQDFNIHYKWLNTGNSNTPTETLAKQNNKMFGIGFRAGLNGSWFFTKNWSIYGSTAFDLLSTRSKLDAKGQQFTTANPSSVSLNEYFEQKISFLQPIIELAMGLGWDIWMQDDEYHFGVKVGWEQQTWINNNHFTLITQPGQSGSMSIQGFVLKARFDF